MNFIFVFAGGGLGAMARYGISKIFPTPTHSFPTGTIIANILSCIILGFLLYKLSQKNLQPAYQLFLMTGFCGGFSTFSTFSAESFKLIQNGQSSLAILYIAMSVLICLAAIWSGIKLGELA